MLLAYRSEDRAFFVFGFTKSERSNINEDELVALKGLANRLMRYTDVELLDAIRARDFEEIDDG